MIKRFTEHSANERTYLAWLRTAIAIMAFGFLIEKFNLFLDYLGLRVGDERLRSTVSAEVVGIGALVAGILIVIGATWRFHALKRAIDSETPEPYSVGRSQLMLALLMVAMGLFVLFYLTHRLF